MEDHSSTRGVRSLVLTFVVLSLLPGPLADDKISRLRANTRTPGVLFGIFTTRTKKTERTKLEMRNAENK